MRPSALDSAVPTEVVDQAGLGDALADPGPAQRYSPDGYRRIKSFGHQLTILRARMGQPLPELVAEVERVIGVDVEAQIRARGLRGNITGREHLDAFAEYVADYTERSAATLPGLLAFLESAADIEKGLEPGKVEIAGDAELARRLEKIASGYRPDFEEAFTRVFGDVLGVKIAQGFATGLRFARERGEALVRDGAEYLREESRDLIAPGEMDEFLDDVDALRERGERLEARIARLAAAAGKRA